MPSLLQSQISKSGLKDKNDGSFWMWRHGLNLPHEHPTGAEARGDILTGQLPTGRAHLHGVFPTAMSEPCGVTPVTELSSCSFLLTAVALLSSYSIHLLLKSSGIVGECQVLSRAVPGGPILTLTHHRSPSHRHSCLRAAGLPSLRHAGEAGCSHRHHAAEHRR